MPAVLYCDPEDLGPEPRIYKRGILGSESPLAFTDGHAVVEDADAAAELVRRTPVDYAGSHPDGDPGFFEADESGADGAQTDADADEGDTSDEPHDAAEAAVCDATVQRTGEPCGRDLPCPYHSD